MTEEPKNGLARVSDPGGISARRKSPPEAVQSLEAAFAAFLQYSAGQKQPVPVTRRVFLTLAESAEFTGLPAVFLRRLVADGRLKALKTGAGWRIPRAGLEELPETLLQPPAVREELSEGEAYDLERNKLRRQGLLPQSDL
jgi:excisionase family DNA binding protein